MTTKRTMKSLLEATTVWNADKPLTPENIRTVLAESYGGKEKLDEAAKKSLSRIMHHVQHNHVAIISSQRAGAADNNERHASLIDHIKKAGYGHIHVMGVGQEDDEHGKVRPVGERSIMVIGKGDRHPNELKGFAKKMGDHFGQHSVVFKGKDDKHASLVHTKGSDTPGKEESLGTFHANDTGAAYHTRLKGDHLKKAGGTTRRFHFESTYYLEGQGFFQRKRLLWGGQGED